MSDEDSELPDMDGLETDDRTAKILKAVRAENAKRRVQNRDLAETLQQQQADLQAMQTQAQENKALVDKITAELEAERQARQKEIDLTDAANKAVIASLPEKLQKVVPTAYSPFDLRNWLDAAVPVLTPIAAAPLDGQQGSRPDRQSEVVAVGTDEAAFAAQLGIDPQQLVKEMQKKR